VSVQPVHGERALLVASRGKRWLVIGDLHIGIENDYLKKGFKIPDQAPSLLRRILTLIDDKRPDGLVLLGDVKHRIPIAREFEARKVAQVLSTLSESIPVTVVRGNHDGGLRGILPQGVTMSNELIIGTTGLTHGMSWPTRELMKCRTLVMAHTHPAVLLQDERLRRILEPCWLRAVFRKKATSGFYEPPYPELVVMPAFGDLRSGMAVNEKGAHLLGPLFRNGLADLRNAHIHLADGTYLGKVADLEVEGRGRFLRGQWGNKGRRSMGHRSCRAANNGVAGDASSPTPGTPRGSFRGQGRRGGPGKQRGRHG